MKNDELHKILDEINVQVEQKNFSKLPCAMEDIWAYGAGDSKPENAIE